MRKQYKVKKGSGCALCKPHKHGWEKRWKINDERAWACARDQLDEIAFTDGRRRNQAF